MKAVRFSHLKHSQPGNRVTPFLVAIDKATRHTLWILKKEEDLVSLLVCVTFRLRAMLILAIRMIDGCKRIHAE